MKKKRFDHQNWHRAVSDAQSIYNLSEGILVDYVAGAVTKPYRVNNTGQEITLLDSHHRWVYFSPHQGKHALTVMLDPQDNPIQFYIDINAHNGVDVDGIPYGMDLYLDVAASTDGWAIREVVLLDEDELQAALHKGHIRPELAEFAHLEAERVVEALHAGTFAALNVVKQHLKENPRLTVIP